MLLFDWTLFVIVALLEGETLLSGHLEESSQDCVTMIYEQDGEPLEVLRCVLFSYFLFLKWPVDYSSNMFDDIK